MRTLIMAGLVASSVGVTAQKKMLPSFSETDLWKLGYANGISASSDGKHLVFSVKFYDLEKNKGQNEIFTLETATKKINKITETPESENSATFWGNTNTIVFTSNTPEGPQIFSMNVDGSSKKQITNIRGGVSEFKFSSNGNQLLYTQDVPLEPKLSEKYSDLPKNTGKVYDGLMFRHWNQWADGSYSHLFIAEKVSENHFENGIDLLEGEHWAFPMMPHDGIEQMDISPDGMLIAYACKKLHGTDAAKSTNSEIFIYNVKTKQTSNLTRGNAGYDKEPRFSPDGKSIAWLSMERDGYEADIARLMIADINEMGEPMSSIINITDRWEYNAHHPIFTSNNEIMCSVEMEGTIQIYHTQKSTQWSPLTPITSGFHNYNDFTFSNGKLYGLKSTLLTPNELYSVDPKTKKEILLSHINDAVFAQFNTPTMELIKVQSTDGKEIFTWVIKPANFDEKTEHPALLLCQGGPQSMVGQGFSTRWNTRVMAGHGYVVLYPNRRGLPGFGKEWNESISGDWGGQAMQDLLSVTDYFASKPYVNKEKMGAVGASFGGYSVYWLAGNHNNRFKAFIAHCGIFNTESMYASTEEVFFSDWDSKGPFWNEPKSKTYTEFSPHLYVKNWNTPILVIHNEKDFRVPLEQGIMAFTSAQLLGVPSKFLVFPDEGHWVLKPQNSVAWNREFFNWLDQYLK
jgi:dipeptidyl aminopeptidase/acylaminoacyl peptidase